MSRQGICAAGNWIVDRVKIVDHWPEQDTLVDIQDELIGNGGGAFNVLVDLARLGAPFPLEGIGLVGEDPDGDWVLAVCQENDIGSRWIERCSRPTSHTDVISASDSGRRTFFHQRGANTQLGPEHIVGRGTTSKIFYLGYALLLDNLDRSDPEFGTAAARVLSDVSAQGAKTAMDVVSEDSDRFARIVTAALPHLDWLFLNEFEAGRTLGVQLRREKKLDVPQLELAARQLLSRGIREVVFIHAPEGAMAASSTGEVLWQPSVKLAAAEIAGTVGAGDAFAAGALLGLHDDEPLRECLSRGVCAAAASLRHASASEGILPLEMCLALAGSHGFRT